MPLTGDTVRLRVTFHTFEGTKADPLDVILRIYDKNEQLIDGPFYMTEANHDGPGEFHFDYTLPKTKEVRIYEWTGILEGTPVVARGQIEAKFI